MSKEYTWIENEDGSHSTVDMTDLPDLTFHFNGDFEVDGEIYPDELCAIDALDATEEVNSQIAAAVGVPTNLMSREQQFAREYQCEFSFNPSISQYIDSAFACMSEDTTTRKLQEEWTCEVVDFAEEDLIGIIAQEMSDTLDAELMAELQLLAKDNEQEQFQARFDKAMKDLM